MKIHQKLNEDDKKKLEYMLSFRYKMPYEAFGNQKLARRFIYILTSVLYFFAAFMLWRKVYVVFALELVVALLATVWIIWHQLSGKKFERTVHEIIYEKLGGEADVIVDEDKIVYGGINHSYDKMKNIIFYEEFLFVFLQDKRVFLMKLTSDEKEYVKKLFDKHEYIVQEEKTQPFNLLTYFKNGGQKGVYV